MHDPIRVLATGSRTPAAAEPSPLAYDQLDPETSGAVQAFLERIRQSDPSLAALLYGSRARGTHTAGSDADIAVVLKGKPQNRYAVLGRLADAAFDVLMDTGIMSSPSLSGRANFSSLNPSPIRA